MEAVHKTGLLTWISEPVDMHGLLKMASESPLDNCFYKNKTVEECMKELCPDVDFKKVAEACNLDNYYSPLEEKITLGRQFEIPPEVDRSFLTTLTHQKEHMDKRNNDTAYDVFYYNSSKTLDYPIGKPIAADIDASSLSEDDFIKLPELLLTVQVYHPIRRDPHMVAIKMQIDQEFQVVAQQKLTELRDKITCTADEVIFGEWSNAPDSHVSGDVAKNIYMSGTFYFGTTFYNDGRFAGCENYGKEIKEWAEKHGKGIGPFECKSMEYTRFIDLNICLGYPYVYIHQGNCEHLVVFTEVRLMTKDDILTRPSYPTRARAFSKKGIFCMVCHKVIANWIVTNHPLLPEEPFVFCDACFKQFNYVEDEQKICNFKARVLPDSAAIF